MKIIKSIFLLSLFFTLPFGVKAWGVIGHRVVGQIADSYLTKKAKLELRNILGVETLALASTWSDFIKSDPSYRYLSNWHYVNLESALTYDKMNAFLNADTATDAYTKINFMVKELKTKRNVLSKETKLLYVRMLIHVIGDLHQPMHLGRVDDRGGNSVRVKWFSDDVNLHQVWDEKLVEFQQLSYTEYATAINHTTAAQRKIWQQQSLSQWMYDTYLLTEKVYAETKADQRLDFLYNFKFVAPMNDQLLKGGVHLAGVFNDIFR